MSPSTPLSHARLVRPAPPLALLLGMPGCGKTALGSALASSLGWHFIDLDAKIQVRDGRACARIIDEDGEEHFRELESRALSEAMRPCDYPTLLSPGSGIVARCANHQNLGLAHLRIWLLCPHAELIARIGWGLGASTRPLARAQSAQELGERLDALWFQRREAWVSLATHRVEQSEAFAHCTRLLTREHLEALNPAKGSALC